ncbi:MaoC/PaaZ C-terminal domain-containing protein [Zwartia vadi]|uniref:MaoC/PaaZ C-terminal domain-containing protein n=1 Tax=Zwartia vadi TaxID=3058168 RepID=UPI0025B588D2|nr:MaoC/PaaZ C-terminal domain-containing protein [Zwartia vadi]MDN3988863.1 MaoC/PaaZ C-terminal domain-containing protein [Zwartia vadi]
MTIMTPDDQKQFIKNLKVGYSFDSNGRTITEADVVNFACLSGDFNRLHVDKEFASNTRFGQRIAHGLLVLSVMSGLTTQSSEYRLIEPSIVALVSLGCKFPKPTFIGDTVFVRITVVDIIHQIAPGRDQVVFRREAVNQRGEVVVEADFVMQMRNGESA